VSGRHDTGFRTSAFRPTDGKAARYSLDDIPEELWARFRARCVAERISVRAVLLTFMQRYGKKK